MNLRRLLAAAGPAAQEAAVPPRTHARSGVALRAITKSPVRREQIRVAQRLRGALPPVAPGLAPMR